LRAAYGAHDIGAAILFVVGVQNEQDVQRTSQYRVGAVFRLNHLPQHVHEVLGVAQVVVRIDIRVAQAVPVGVGRDGGHLADQPVDLQFAHLRVTHISRVWIDGREGGHCADEHGHGMSIVMEALEESLGGFVQHGVMSDVGDKVLQLHLGRQFAVEDQIGDLQKRAFLRKLLDGIPSITKNALVAINEGDRALTRRCVQKRRIVAHKPEIFRAGLNLTQIGCANCTRGNRQLVRSAGALIHNIQSFLVHETDSFPLCSLKANHRRT
jgi:hypothetical protein